MLRKSERHALRSKVRRVAGALERFLGVPRQETRLPAPLDMLIATILSQNTNDKNSHRAYTALRSKFPGWGAVARAQRRTLVATIRAGGMANQKGERIQSVLADVKRVYGSYDLQALRSKTNEEVVEDLTRMKGVGSKTAACVLLFSLGRDVFPVDTHVHRICLRLGLARDCKTPEETFEAMKNLVPRGKGYSFHTNMIRFGRKMCRANSPACDLCLLYEECIYEKKKKRASSLRRTPSPTDHDFMVLDNV